MVATIAGHRFIREVLRLVARPTLDRFARMASLQTTEVDRAVRAVVEIPDEDLARWAGEYDALDPPASSPRTGTVDPLRWTVEDLHAKLLYLVVRRLRPETMLETGVHHGLSTRAVLSAMAQNGRGRLVSTEVSPDVGDLVPTSLRDRWELRVIRPTIPALERAVRNVGAIDVFLHDSRHTYRWQRAEYRLGWAALRPGGLFLSDDIDSSYAFIDACRRWRIPPVVLVGRTKVFGMVRKPAPSP
ncbi:MAG: class I SAM-dependent methyltransferase [Thermoplasmata archaeon]|nr:class I SAM-dependent methyltransferase [Thermoplasmata archaeon]